MTYNNILRVGDKAPDFNLMDEQGNFQTLKTLKKSYDTILLWWAPTPSLLGSNCGHCHHVHEETEVIPKLISQGVRVVGLNYFSSEKNKEFFGDDFLFKFTLLTSNRQTAKDYHTLRDLDDGWQSIPKPLAYLVESYDETIIDVIIPRAERNFLRNVSNKVEELFNMEFAKIVDEKIVEIGKPRRVELEGRPVSNPIGLGVDQLVQVGWLPIEDDIPSYDPEMQELGEPEYEILDNKVIRSYKAKQRSDVDPEPSKEQDEIIRERIEMVGRARTLEELKTAWLHGREQVHRFIRE